MARIGGYSKWAADPDRAAEATQGAREARARLDLLIAHRHIVEAAEEYTAAQQRLCDLGLVP